MQEHPAYTELLSSLKDTRSHSTYYGTGRFLKVGDLLVWTPKNVNLIVESAKYTDEDTPNINIPKEVGFVFLREIFAYPQTYLITKDRRIFMPDYSSMCFSFVSKYFTMFATTLEVINPHATKEVRRLIPSLNMLEDDWKKGKLETNTHISWEDYITYPTEKGYIKDRLPKPFAFDDMLYFFKSDADKAAYLPEVRAYLEKTYGKERIDRFSHYNGTNTIYSQAFEPVYQVDIEYINKGYTPLGTIYHLYPDFPIEFVKDLVVYLLQDKFIVKHHTEHADFYYLKNDVDIHSMDFLLSLLKRHTSHYYTIFCKVLHYALDENTRVEAKRLLLRTTL